MHTDQQAAVFAYLDLLGNFWEKSISEQRLQHLEEQMPIVLTKLELVLPAGVGYEQTHDAASGTFNTPAWPMLVLVHVWV